jgi:hypothetical protein
VPASRAPDPEVVRDTTSTLLEQRRYREGMRLEQGEPDDFVDVLYQRIGDWILALIDLQETNPVLYWAVIVGLVVIAGLLVWHITYTVRRSSRTPVRAPSAVGEVVGTSDLDALRQRQREAVAAGELLLALQLRFAIAVAESIGVPRLRNLGHMTYRELIAVGQRAGVPEDLVPTVDAIEQTLYGGQELDDRKYERCVRALEPEDGP